MRLIINSKKKAIYSVLKKFSNKFLKEICKKLKIQKVNNKFLFKKNLFSKNKIKKNKLKLN